jgi:hypothetical protein
MNWGIFAGVGALLLAVALGIWVKLKQAAATQATDDALQLALKQAAAQQAATDEQARLRAQAERKAFDEKASTSRDVADAIRRLDELRGVH